MDSKSEQTKPSATIANSDSHNYFIAGIFIGSCFQLTTSLAIIFTLCIVTNKEFPQPVIETFGYVYPSQMLQGILGWIYCKIVLVIPKPNKKQS